MSDLDGIVANGKCIELTSQEDAELYRALVQEAGLTLAEFRVWMRFRSVNGGGLES